MFQAEAVCDTADSSAWLSLDHDPLLGSKHLLVLAELDKSVGSSIIGGPRT